MKNRLFKTALMILATTPLFVSAKNLPKSAKLAFQFELPKIETSNYERPYVAVWLENKDRQSVKTIELWVGEDEWLKDLRSWWRKVGRYDKQLVDGVTSATRPAGKYRFIWDGKDDKGNLLPQGEYTLHVEVVREHGGRNYLRQKMMLSDSPKSYQLQPTAETGDISVTYSVR
ncbi:MAG: DUF2271 domain-containing protein [Parashewanella sp.]